MENNLENQNYNNQVNKSNKMGIGILIGVLITIIIVLSSFIVYKEFIEKDKVENNSTDTKNNTIENQNRTENQEQKLPTTQSSEISKIDLNKCLNNKNEKYSNPIETTSGNTGLSISINPDQKNAKLFIDWSIFSKLTGEVSGGRIEEYSIVGFSKKILSAFIGERGQDIHGTTLIFLMEDNTLEYLPLFIEKKDSKGNTWFEINFNENNFKSSGTVNGVSEVVKLYNADISDGRTILAAKKDGSFYDLNKIIK